MKSSYFWRRAVVLAALALAFAGTAIAQVGTGNLFGTVIDDQGAPLPGVTLELSGQGAPQVAVTDAQGAFRFPALSPGDHSLRASLDGFSTTELPRVVIGVNRNTSIEITMASAAAVQEVITVTAETPLLDERKTQLGATYTSMELEKIPTARDPWAMIQSTPGVLTDRINVGGNESGQQANYIGPGAQGDQSIWSIDGMVITDMSATGSSPGYYDFDSFEEVQVGTGGSETTTASPGVVLNIVTKRGTNEWRGSARYLLTDDSWQSDLDFDQGELAGASHFNASTANPGGNSQNTFKQGNRIVEITDMGLEVGGPIIKDKLWVWGSYADQQIDLLTISDFPDATTLEGYNFKVNAQITPNNSATAFIYESDKVKIGRNAGPTRPPETTWNQDGYGDWPGAGKLEDTHIFSSNFYLTGMYSRVNGGFQLRPQGGEKYFTLDTGSVWHQSFFDIFPIDRPQEQFKADASNFFNTGAVSHELKYGAGYRTAEQFSISRAPVDGWEINLGGGYSYVILSSPSILNTEAEYTNVYAQDTLSVGNLTANFGLRYDQQTGNNPPVSVPASKTNPLPGLAGDSHNPGLPATTYPGADAGFTWESIVPRLGLSYALGEEKKTILRASYSRFADQLANGVIAQVNPNYPQRYTYWIGYYNNSGVFNPADLLYQYALGPNVNPLTGGLLISSGVDPSLDPPMTDELILGVEHALLPEFVVGLQGTYRKTTDLLELETLVFDGDAYAPSTLNSIGRPHRRSDYIVSSTLTGTLPDGTSYALPVWDLRPGVTTRRGTFLENGDREWDYLGVAVTATKRLSNRWMMRGNFTWNDWTWGVPQSELENPALIANTGLDGQEVITGSGVVSGAKGNVWIQSSYSYALNALYQVAPDRPWGFNIATNITGREGYPRQFLRRTTTQWGGSRTDLRILDDPTSVRHEDVTTFDARVEKEFTFSNFNLTLGIDGFNLLNDATVLQRQSLRGFSSLSGVGGDHVTEILSPRVFRVGARISFR